ncbi:MAG: sporulation protein YqfC [Tissierella sp.]|uniref:sporulation protein YqfC n=1 Tax=Tissierella sp. TaxID=41274 RepID=UPI003F9E4CC1
MKKNIKKAKLNITNALELPLDVALDLPKVTVIGNIKVEITNHKGIIEYKNEIIRVNTNIGILKITGDSLEIKNIFIEEINIDGNIEKIEITN